MRFQFAIVLVMLASCVTSFGIANDEIGLQSIRDSFKRSTMVRKSQIRHELELSREQWNELDKRFHESLAGYRKASEIANAMEDAEARKSHRRFASALHKQQLAADVDEVLLDWQLQRLDQLIAQYRHRAGGIAAVMDDPTRTKLNISIETLEEILERSEDSYKDKAAEILKLRHEYEKKVKEIIDKYDDHILGPLSPEQRQAYRELFGPPLGTEE